MGTRRLYINPVLPLSPVRVAMLMNVEGSVFESKSKWDQGGMTKDQCSMSSE